MQSKIALIIEREYRTRVLKRSFWVLTLLMPFLMVIAFGIVPFLMATAGQDKQVVAVIDHTGLYESLFVSTSDYEFHPESVGTLSSARREGKQASEEREYTAFLEIRQDLHQDPEAVSLFGFKTIPDGLQSYIDRLLEQHLTSQNLERHGGEGIERIIAQSKVRLHVPSYKIGSDGSESNVSGAIASAIGMVMTILIYTILAAYGGMVLQGVMEEKKSRIMEVMISSVRPFELMMGKIIGIGLVGLTQLLLWGILSVAGFIGVQYFIIGGLYSPEAMAMVEASGEMSAEAVQGFSQAFEAIGSVPWGEVVTLFVLFFIGGYFFFASIFAAIGSAISSEEDAGAMTGVMSMILLACFYVGIACFKTPESPLAIWASYIPLTSPEVMLVRAVYGVELWEEVLSLVLLYGSAVGMVFVSAKIYRTGVLMYGKKVSFKEMMRWLRTS